MSLGLQVAAVDSPTQLTLSHYGAARGVAVTFSSDPEAEARDDALELYAFQQADWDAEALTLGRDQGGRAGGYFRFSERGGGGAAGTGGGGGGGAGRDRFRAHLSLPSSPDRRLQEPPWVDGGSGGGGGGLRPRARSDAMPSLPGARMPLTVHLQPEPEEGGEGWLRRMGSHANDDSEEDGEDDDDEEEAEKAASSLSGARGGLPAPQGQRGAPILGLGKARRRQKALHRRVRSLGDLEYLDLEY